MPEREHDRYDAVIVGTGQAGPPLAGRLTAAGWSVAIAERARFGGTCVNTGCTPTKAMLASAEAAHAARRAGDYGVTLGGEVGLDMGAVKARRESIVRPKREGVESWLRGMEGCDVHTGQARLAGPHEVEVGDALLRGERLFLNVGARARIPEIPGIESVPALTDASMMELDRVPEHLLIIGGGYVALEFAQMYRRFGAAVTILEHGPRIASSEDADVSDALRRILEGEDVRILTEADPVGVEPGRDGEVRLTVERDGARETLTGSHLLAAAGRVPNTDDLGLEVAGIETDARGFVRVDDALTTSLPHVWALGDCNGRGAFTHTSYNDHEIVAANLLDGAARRVSDRIPAYAIYTDPPLARVGMSEAQMRQSGREALIATMAMEDVARAQERSETAGFMKILVDAGSEQIVGAALLGTRCDETVHLLIDAMAARAPYTTVRDTVHIHPTVAELIPSMLQQLKPL